MTFNPKKSSEHETALRDAYSRAVAKSNTPAKDQRQSVSYSRKTLTLAEFNAIPPHRKQRNTERHAKILLKSLIQKGDLGRMDEVSIAKYPDGALELLNAHTRQYLWNNLKWPPPEVLKVTYYLVEDAEHSDRLYDSFDTNASRKDSRDDMESAANAAGWQPQSSAFKNGRGAFAIKNAFAIYNCLHGTHSLITDEVHKVMIDDMMAVDRVLTGHTMPHSFIISAALVTFRIYGNDALDFLQKIVNKEESLSTAPHQHVLKRIGGAGEGDVRDSVAFYLAAFRAFRGNRNIKRMEKVDLISFVKSEKEKYGIL